MKISRNQIWEVTTDNFITSKIGNLLNRRVLLAKGERIEIRHTPEWGFRTEDDQYFHADEKMILDNCKLIGLIPAELLWKNKVKLREILSLKSYQPLSS